MALRFGGLRLGGQVDRYVAKLFALSYLAAFLLVVGLAFIMELAVGIDDILDGDEAGQTPPVLLVAEYFGLLVPFLYLDMSPYVTLVAGLFTAAKMTRFGEVVAALSSGVSVRRLLFSALAGSILLAGGMFALREWATGELGARRAQLLDRLEMKRERQVLENFFVYTPSGQRVHIHEYLPATAPGEVPEIRLLTCRYRQGDRQIYLLATRATPLENGAWALEGAERVEAADDALVPSNPEVLDEVRFTPADVELSYRGRENPMGLSFGDSRTLLERDPSNAKYRTLLHHHLSFPLAGVVLLLVGLPFVLGQERGRAGERTAKGFLLCFGYFGIEFIARTLGLQGQLGPLFAAWLPVLAFGALGTVLFSYQHS